MPDVLEHQPTRKGLIIHPDSEGNYPCKSCSRSFPHPEPYRYHASKHNDTVEYIYDECKQLATLKPEIKAFLGVYCDGSTHYVRMAISQPVGLGSTIKGVDEEVELAFEEFLRRDFSSTEMHKETVPRQSRSSRWPSRPNTRLKSPHPSTEAITANDRHSLDAEDQTSSARDSLPEHVTGIVAVASFSSTADGVHGHKILVTTHSDTMILLGLVDLDALLRHTRIRNQLPQIIGDYAYTELLEYRKKRMTIEDPVYQGILPDDLPIGVGEEVRLEDCSPVLEAEVRSLLDS
ncbi:hypothetical protein COCSADRAFT_24538 [Bipolaris sorokiniana ND90Pr]|uniref:C2H2-type domain-containing protein n=1 Tax=Cochliobolus sativus (strain ND90Pr / ATCC 201652) TaxID=665912 RepID=M2TB29_COCSN|nr:uncharacterized protein COCSADRAFT_24538 [Bipolaris sorokiniana ND90Pr]EMD66426.1 hypothetical protein COCSADRAFT_24538 [Bipolaris sorokiniana ND90Pr]